MLRFAAPVCLVLAIAGSLSPARAGDEEGFWYNVHLGWHRNNEWPQPFSAADRNYAVAPFAVMIAGGWQRQNLIGENYFDDNSMRLNSAGVERVRFILRQTPVEHRVLYVQSDLDDNITRLRVDAIQETIVALQPKGPMPEVIVSNMVPEGRSAEMVAAEFKNFVSSTPATRLSHASGGGNGSGSSGSNGSSSGGGTSGGN
jgi:uncharacterized membrane protein YgcG